MMWPWFFSDFALALLSSCIYFSFLTNTLQFDVSDDLFGVPLSSGLGSSTNDPSLDPISNSELLDAFTSDESLTLGDPPIIDSFISSDLFGQDNLLSQNLLQSSNDQCSFNSALVNADSGQTEYFLRRFKKRRSETECKNPQRGSNSNEPPPPPEDPQNFLNGLPLFEGYEDSDLHEDTEICEPRLHLDRTIPMCLIGLSEMAVALEWYADVKPVGCAPCMSFILFFGRYSEADDSQSVSLG